MEHLKQHIFGTTKKPGWGDKFVVIVLVLSVVLVSVASVVTLFVGKDRGKIDENTYQVVVLANGQSYFGQLDDINDEYVTLTDVFYLQSQQAQQANDQEEQDQDNQTQLQLTRLGGEIHQPQNQMFIAKTNISYWENLKPDSKVVKSIQDYYNKQ